MTTEPIIRKASPEEQERIAILAEPIVEYLMALPNHDAVAVLISSMAVTVLGATGKKTPLERLDNQIFPSIRATVELGLEPMPDEPPATMPEANKS